MGLTRRPSSCIAWYPSPVLAETPLKWFQTHDHLSSWLGPKTFPWVCSKGLICSVGPAKDARELRPCIMSFRVFPCSLSKADSWDLLLQVLQISYCRYYCTWRRHQPAFWIYVHRQSCTVIWLLDSAQAHTKLLVQTNWFKAVAHLLSVFLAVMRYLWLSV